MSRVKNYSWQIKEAHGQLQSPKSLTLSATADELMRFPAPTLRLASMKGRILKYIIIEILNSDSTFFLIVSLFLVMGTLTDARRDGSCLHGIQIKIA